MTRARYVFIAVLVVTLLAPVALFVIPSNSSGNAYIVMSDSMGDAVPEGSLIITTKVRPESLQESDIVVFEYGEGAPVTHRIIDHRLVNGTNFFRTKGDANENADPGWVEEDSIMGKKLMVVPYLGYAASFVGSEAGLVMFVFVPAMLLILVEVVDVIQEVRADRDQERPRSG